MSDNAQNITLDTVVAQADDVLSAEVGKDVVMMRLASGAYYDSNEIGAEIWRLMAAPISVRAMCDRLMEIYDITSDKCQADVLDFLRKALEEGTIRIV